MIRNCILDNTYGVHVVIKFIIVQHNYDQNLLKLLKITTVIIAMIASVWGVDSELLHLSVLLKTYNGAYLGKGTYWQFITSCWLYFGVMFQILNN